MWRRDSFTGSSRKGKVAPVQQKGMEEDMIKFKRKDKKFALFPKRCTRCGCVFWLGYYHTSRLFPKWRICEDCVEEGRDMHD